MEHPDLIQHQRAFQEMIQDSSRRPDDACMKSAAEAGLAPLVWYTSTEDRISIADFVDARPFPATEAVVRLPVSLQALHALPPFPKPMNYADALDGFIGPRV